MKSFFTFLVLRFEKMLPLNLEGVFENSTVCAKKFFNSWFQKKIRSICFLSYIAGEKIGTKNKLLYEDEICLLLVIWCLSNVITYKISEKESERSKTKKNFIFF